MNRTRLLRIASLTALTTLALGVGDAAAQQPYYPPPPQPYPQQPQPYPNQPYPQPPPQPGYQPYPDPNAQPGYQPQPYQPQPYQPQPYQPQPYQPYPPPVQPPPPQNQIRSGTEMLSLYIVSAIYGVGTGIWLDALLGIDDPGAAVIMPLILGAGAPVGVFFWDRYGGPLPRGVPAATATGLVLGGLEGMAIAGTQWQYTHEQDKEWSFAGQTSITFALATAGGIGGFAFGEWLKPDPRSMTFIGSGAGWGTLSGSLIGISVQDRHDDWKDGSSIAGLIGFNVAMVGAGAISVFHTPSFRSQKWMWLGYLAGAVAGSLVFPFYAFQDNPNLKRGLIGPAIGSFAGAGLAGALTWDMRDPGDVQAKFTPPVDLSLAPIPALTPTATSHTSAASRSLSNLVGPDPRFSTAPPGAMLSAQGTF